VNIDGKAKYSGISAAISRRQDDTVGIMNFFMNIIPGRLDSRD